MYGKKAWLQLQKNAASNIKQVLEAAPHKAPTTHHKNHQKFYLKQLNLV